MHFVFKSLANAHLKVILDFTDKIFYTDKELIACHFCKRRVLKWAGNPSFVDKRDASKNTALWCGIFVHKEHGLLKNKNNWERMEEFGGVK